jgi:hypothetical protein
MKEFLFFLGISLVILAIGACNYLCDRGDALRNHTEQKDKEQKDK